MSSHTRRPINRVSFNVSLFLALLLAGFAGLTSLTRQTGAVVAPTSKTEKTFAPLGLAAYATPTPWPTATKCAISRWWAEGNANDSNGLNPGTVTSLKNGATFGPGATGQAFNLDGLPGLTTGDYVEIPINTPAMNQPGSFTWEACVYPLSLKGRVPVVFSKEATSTNRAGLQINSNGSLCSYMNSNWCAQTSALGLVVPNQWTRVTLIYNGSTQKLITYVNGAQVSSATVGVPYNHSNSPAPFHIGWSKHAGGNAHFYGFIDEVSFSTCVVPPTTTPCACGATPSPTPTPIP
jgi:hypothetical protein